MLEERIQTITKELSHWYLNNLIIKRKMHRTSTSKGSEKDSDDEKRPPQDPFKKIDNSHYTPKKKKRKKIEEDLKVKDQDQAQEVELFLKAQI